MLVSRTVAQKNSFSVECKGEEDFLRGWVVGGRRDLANQIEIDWSGSGFACENRLPSCC